MLPNLPLDVDGKQIRVGDKVVFGITGGSALIVGEVCKIRPCFVWIKTYVNGYLWRRGFSKVTLLGR